METELLGLLEKKVEDLLAGYAALKLENVRLSEENRTLLADRGQLKARIDAILMKLEGI